MRFPKPPRCIVREHFVENSKIGELSEKILELMESYNLKVFDLEYINELIEKTLEREEKECSY